MFQFNQQFLNINKHPFTLKTESLMNEIEKLKRAAARKAVLDSLQFAQLCIAEISYMKLYMDKTRIRNIGHF